MNFGVIGYGYWGPNVVRNLESLEDSQVLAIAEMSPGCAIARTEGLSRYQCDTRCSGLDFVA